MLTAPVLDPDAVWISKHAMERYAERRSTRPDMVREGLQNLLEKAATRPTPALHRTTNGRYHRAMLVSGFVLIFNPEMTVLISLWRAR